MVFSRFVETGRAVIVHAGPDTGKMAVIVDIVDHNRAIVECPQTGVKRQVLSYKRMSLTDHKIHVPRGCRTKYLKKCVEDSELVSKWEASEPAMRIAAKTRRATLTDFERFQVGILKRKKQRILKAVAGTSN